MLTARGGISIHEGTNQVFVRDTAAVIEAIREVIRNVDIPPKQVMIEARIVEASTGFANSLGVRMTAGNIRPTAAIRSRAHRHALAFWPRRTTAGNRQCRYSVMRLATPR
jgi:type II secretory pathway component HofQ